MTSNGAYKSAVVVQGGDATWRFNVGEKVMGRVAWNPGQDLSHAYRLQIERVLLCAGRDASERQGCLNPSPGLVHRFVLLVSVL